MESTLVKTLVPIFVCVVLPIAIVLITSLAKINGENKRTQIIIKAIEANKDVDTDKLIESLKKPQKTAREILNLRLLRGCIFSLIGIALAIVGFVNSTTGTEFSADPVTVPFIFGGISLAIGISYLIVWKVTRKQIDSSAEK
jgi:ABC-type Fe3+-siderophore transport system permease subunit